MSLLVVLDLEPPSLHNFRPIKFRGDHSCIERRISNGRGASRHCFDSPSAPGYQLAQKNS